MISLIRAAWQEELRVPMFVGLSTDGYPDSDNPAMKNGARIYHMDTGKEYEYSQDDDDWYEVPSDGGSGASSWSELTDKPFDTIGSGLEVDSDNSLNVIGEVVDVGSNQYVYESYSLPAIPADKLRTIYANHKDNKTQVIKWTLLGSETYLTVLSADYIVGTYSIDVLVHNKYHCQYNFDADTTGNVNPEVLKDELETFVFKGYVSTTEPSGTLKQNELWYQGSILPIVFPIQVKRYDGTAWSAETEDYTPNSLDMWADLENDHGYYWFGNNWNIIDVNVAYDDVTIGLNAQGQLEVKTSAIPTIQAMNDAISSAIGSALPDPSGIGAIITSPDGETWESSKALVVYDDDGAGAGAVVSYGQILVQIPDTGESIALNLDGYDEDSGREFPQIAFGGQHAGGSLYVDGTTDPYNPRLMYNGKELANTEQVSSAITSAIGDAIGGSY